MVEDKEIMKVQSSYFQYPQTKYLPLRKADLSKLKANEIEVIKVGEAQSYLLDAMDLTEFGIQWMEKAFGDKE